MGAEDHEEEEDEDEDEDEEEEEKIEKEICIDIEADKRVTNGNTRVADNGRGNSFIEPSSHAGAAAASQVENDCESVIVISKGTAGSITRDLEGEEKSDEHEPTSPKTAGLTPKLKFATLATIGRGFAGKSAANKEKKPDVFALVTDVGLSSEGSKSKGKRISGRDSDRQRPI